MLCNTVDSNTSGMSHHRFQHVAIVDARGAAARAACHLEGGFASYRRAVAGTKPSPRRRAALAKLHPGGLTDDWADKLVGEAFTSANQKVTHEHYSQVCHLLLLLLLLLLFSLVLPCIACPELQCTGSRMLSSLRPARLSPGSTDPALNKPKMDFETPRCNDHPGSVPFGLIDVTMSSISASNAPEHVGLWLWTCLWWIT